VPQEPPNRCSSFIILSVAKISVKLDHDRYDVLIAAGLLKSVGKELRRRLPSPQSQVFVVTSPKVRRHWGRALEQSLKREKLRFHVLEMNDGEPAKRLETVEKLAEQMVQAGADRRSLLAAFGGGVVGDSAGFLAAIFLRGIPFVQIPTTVVAQLDASIGGKTGVNLRAGKNLVGAFHQPRAVLVDPQVLETLDEREFRAGLFEALKCGVIRDKKLFDFMVREQKKILARDAKAVEHVIIGSVRVKADVVSADERESGLRRILNFGHTVGHALEAATGYTRLLHGEAVALGMAAATAIALDAEFCPPKIAEQITAAIDSYGCPPPVKVRLDSVVSLLKADKKAVAGQVHWVLPQNLGTVTISSDVPANVVRQAIEGVTSDSKSNSKKVRHS
jgi:3-dehydroquinate synthase